VVDNIKLYAEDPSVNGGLHVVEHYLFEYEYDRARTSGSPGLLGTLVLENDKAPSDAFKADYLAHTRYRDYLNWSKIPEIGIYTAFYEKKPTLITYDEVNIIVPNYAGRPTVVHWQPRQEYPQLEKMSDIRTCRDMTVLVD